MCGVKLLHPPTKDLTRPPAVTDRLTRKTKKRYPGCVAHVVSGMRYSVVTNRQPNLYIIYREGWITTLVAAPKIFDSRVNYVLRSIQIGGCLKHQDCAGSETLVFTTADVFQAPAWSWKYRKDASLRPHRSCGHRHIPAQKMGEKSIDQSETMLLSTAPTCRRKGGRGVLVHGRSRMTMDSHPCNVRTKHVLFPPIWQTVFLCVPSDNIA